MAEAGEPGRIAAFQEHMTSTSRDIKKDPVRPEDSLSEPIGSLSIELDRMSAEIQSISSGFQSQMHEAVANLRAAFEDEYRTRFDHSMEQLREQMRLQIREEMEKEFQEEQVGWKEHLQSVRSEIEEVSGRLETVAKEIAAMLDDPSVELSKIIRKRGEQAELKAFLDGLRRGAQA